MHSPSPDPVATTQPVTAASPEGMPGPAEVRGRLLAAAHATGTLDQARAVAGELRTHPALAGLPDTGTSTGGSPPPW